MPTAALRPCLACGALNDSLKCAECVKKADKQDRGWRGSAASRGYDAAWVRFRAWFIRRYPLCQDCLDARKVMPTQEVHHVKKLKDFPELRLVESNCMPLCRSHHSVRTERGE